MHRFFGPVIAPLLDAAEPETIVEIGCGTGALTARLLSFGGARVRAIDPLPRLSEAALAEKRLVVHEARSEEVLPLLGPVDLAVLDGDPNWHAVHADLTSLSETARRAGRPAPLILVHGVHWPFGRRDGYYDPTALPAHARREPVSGGLVPGAREPMPEDGLRLTPYCARREFGERNGVLAAVEDFLASDPGDWTLVDLPGFHGVAVLAEAERVVARPPIGAALGELRSPRALARQARRAEGARIVAEVRLARLASTTDPETTDPTVAALLVERDAALTSARAERGAALAALRESTARADRLAAELEEARERASAASAELADLTARPEGAELVERRARQEALAWRLEQVEGDLEARRAELAEAIAGREREHGSAAAATVRLEHAVRDLEAARREARELGQSLERAEAELRALEEREAEQRDRAELLAGRLAHHEEALEAEERTARRLGAELAAERERLAALLERDARVGEHLDLAASRRAHRAAGVWRRLTGRRSPLALARAELVREPATTPAPDGGARAEAQGGDAPRPAKLSH